MKPTQLKTFQLKTTLALCTSILLTGSALALPTATDMNYTFERGFPSGNTTEMVYNASDLRRAIEAYKTFVPTVASEAVMQQMQNAGAKVNEVGIVMATSPMQQFAAANSDTPYALTTLDLKAGPMVVEIPANPLIIGFLDDHNMGWVQDAGAIGPGKGKGSKLLILPPDFEGEIPEGYVVSQSKTWKLVTFIRVVPLKGVANAIKAVDDVKIYPLAKADKPATNRFIDVSNKTLPLPLLEWEGTLEYWRQLHAIINAETVPAEYRYVTGILAELGIEKNKPFNPDARTKRILQQAAKTAHEEMRVSLYDNRSASRLVWPDRRWEYVPLATMNRQSGRFGTIDVRDVNASDHYFHLGYGTSPAIGIREVGKGSMYYMNYKDESGTFFDGGKNYKMTVPGPVPAGLFWSATAYDSETRCLVENQINRAAVRSHLDKPAVNADGSYDIYFGPKAPKGKENNWVQTIPDKGWFSAVRVYAPLQPLFDGSWKLGDITELQ